MKEELSRKPAQGSMEEKAVHIVLGILFGHRIENKKLESFYFPVFQEHLWEVFRSCLVLINKCQE